MDNQNNDKLTLLSERQLLGNELEVIRKYGQETAVTDLCILTGGYVFEYIPTDDEVQLNLAMPGSIYYYTKEDTSLKGRVGSILTMSSDDNNKVIKTRSFNGSIQNYSKFTNRSGNIRPVLNSFDKFSLLSPYRVKGFNGSEVVEYGEYPQYAADQSIQRVLESEYKHGLKKTGNSYTFDSVKNDDDSSEFSPASYEEYEYHGKRYIRLIANSCTFEENRFILSNNMYYKNGDYVWIEVSPVEWLIDDRSQLLISKKALVSGIKESNENNYENSDIEKYLDEYLLKEITQSISFISKKHIENKESNTFSFPKIFRKSKKKKLEEMRQALLKQKTEEMFENENRDTSSEEIKRK